ncbi:hypothetical protein LCGC14_1702980, partial [marine sediment metagenome]|nr:hypothetical protein [Pricia sp.]
YDDLSCLAVFDFHHLSLGNKIIKKGRMFSEFHKEVIDKEVIKEIEGCVLLCANCHRKIHFGGSNEY